MAGAFTHFIISDQAKSRKDKLGVDLWQLLNKHYRFLFLGSVSPDLPYLSIGKDWADVMHWEKTDSVFRLGYPEIKSTWGRGDEADRAKLVWLLGYVSHMVADAVIHPVVKEIVGAYCEETKERHRICEMTQDSIVFFNMREGQDIKYGEFADMVHFCKASTHFEKVMEFWKKIMQTGYPEKDSTPHPQLWFDTYSEAIDFADGNSIMAALFRHIGPGETFIYKTADEITAEKNGDYGDYFKAVKIPGGSTESFETVFEKTVGHVIDAWKDIYAGLAPGGPPISVIKPWYLDDGVDMSSANKEITYWVTA